MAENGSEPIVIGNPDDDHVAIHITRLWSDEMNTIDATFKIRAGAWSGESRCTFHHDELARFAAQIQALYHDVSGTAELDPMEPYLRLRLTCDPRGRVLVEGEARDELGHGNQLRFVFELDQTYLPGVVKALRAVRG